MSDTPRTDAAVREVDVAFVGHWGLASEPQEFVPPEFARELERENAELRENKKRLLDAIDAVLCDPEGQACFGGTDADRAVIQDAIDAARKGGQL